MPEVVSGRRVGSSTPLASTTLVIVGHGSHHDARSAAPVYAHADTLRDRGVFADVRTALWKEAPSPRSVLRTVETDVAIVVPLFMAAGYFTESVIPRELGLDGQSTPDADGTVRYTSPVGTHDAVTDVIVERADRVADGRPLGLAIVAHGTERNENSAAAARAHAARIRNRGRFDEVRALYLDESPSVGTLTDHFGTDEVVLVPLFVAEGRHARTDVPAAAGLADGPGDDYAVPTHIDGRRVWYTGPVGTDFRLADVILDRAREAVASGDGGSDRALAPSANNRRNSSESDRCDSTADGGHDSAGSTRPTSTDAPPAWAGPAPRSTAREPTSRSGRAFLRWIEARRGDTAAGAPSRRSPPSASDREKPRATANARRMRSGGRVMRTWGELQVAASTLADGSRTYELRHEADRGVTPTALDRLDRLCDLRDRVRVDERGAFRPLRSAPTLPTGWYCPGLDGATLVRAVETVYPATIADWVREREGSLDVTHFRTTADRQTGIYDRVAALDRSAVDAVVRTCCVDDACLKRRRWEYDDGEAVDVPRGDGAIPCREPCSMVLERARESVVNDAPVEGDDAPNRDGATPNGVATAPDDVDGSSSRGTDR